MATKQTKARKALLESAMILLAQNPGASFIEVAEAAGVGRATLYRHFPTRKDLIHALSMEAFEAINSAVNSKIKRAKSYTHALRLTLEAMIPMGDRYYFLTRLPEVDDEEIWGGIKKQNQELIKLIKEAQKEGGIDPAIPPKWAAAVFNGLVDAAWSQLDEGDIDEKFLIKLAVQTMENGLGYFNPYEYDESWYG